MSISQVFPNYLLIELPETDSTNLYVESILNNVVINEGSIFYTHQQKNGIGQGSNVWESEPFKNITASLVINPTFLLAVDQFYLTIVASLSVCDTVNSLLGDDIAVVKWPNDIYCNHKKIAGLLIKNQVIGSSIATAIVGLGLNVNQQYFHHAPNAISLKILSDKDFDLSVVMSKWHESFAFYYDMLIKNRQALTDRYLSNLYLKDSPQMYLINDVSVSATIKGIDRYGRLILLNDDGRKYVCSLKEVVFPLLG